MVKRRMAVIVFLTCLCFMLFPCCVKATSTADVTGAINTEQDCFLMMSYTCDGTAFVDVTVKLYKIAEVSADFQYTLTSSFSSSGLILNEVRSNDEWNVIRSTLEAYVMADNIAADMVEQTDSSGQVCFASLKPGLYLATVGFVKQGDLNCFFDSALIALPGLGANGLWQYQVSVASKSEMLPPSDEEVELKVLKLWKGDEGQNSRPKKVEVEIFRDGMSYEKIVLSQENNWSYSWTVKGDDTKWTVIERNLPTGYTMTVEKRDTSFVLTNTFVPQNPDGPLDTSQTGDTSNIMLYVLLMIVSGNMLIIIGIIGKRNAYEKSK